MMRRKIAIYGAGGFGKEVKMLIGQINRYNYEWDFAGFYDDNVRSNVLGGVDSLNAQTKELGVVIAISKPSLKKEIISGIRNSKIWFPVLKHPSVLMGENVNVGNGSIITAGNIITEDISIEEHVIINLNCTIGHDAKIGKFSSIMPSVNVSGEVIIKESVYVGTGTQILNRLTIGDNSIIGAGAVVTKDIPPNCTAVGVPAKPVKFHK